MDKSLAQVKSVYLVGIGGIGMSGLALLLKDKGFKVKGSDMKSSYTVDMLQKEGIEVFIGHSPDNISEDIDLVGVSSAINKDNPELAEAKKKNIRVVKRGELLGYLCSDKKIIAVAGSHGKTTTTSLLGYVLHSLGYEPAMFVGGVPLNYSRNAWEGKEYFVMETDESDGSFLCYVPWVSIITNIDYEHLDYYGSIDRLKEDFLKFALCTKAKTFGCGDHVLVSDIIGQVNGVSFGFSKNNKVKAENLCFDSNGSSFDLFIDDKFVLRTRSSLIGEYNVLNMLAVISFFHYIGEDLQKVSDAIAGFKGTKRRFQVKGEAAGVTFVDDYAHHPTEISAVLKAGRSISPERLVAVFQPHRYSRVKALHKEFCRCFSSADLVIITDIYSASESEISGVDVSLLFQGIKKEFSGEIEYIPRNELVQGVPLLLKGGDLVLGLGAGDINLLMDEIFNEFKRNRVKA